MFQLIAFCFLLAVGKKREMDCRTTYLMALYPGPSDEPVPEIKIQSLFPIFVGIIQYL